MWLLHSIPLERQNRTTLPALRLVHQCYGNRICVQGSIVLTQPSPDLIEQRFDLITRDRCIATTGIDQRREQPQCPVELLSSTRDETAPQPTSEQQLSPQRPQSLHLEMWRQLPGLAPTFHCLVMHGQHRIQIWPIECTPPAHRHRQAAVWPRQLDWVADPVRGGDPASRAVAQQWWPLLRPLRPQVLVERSSQRNIHELHPPADAQSGDAEQPGQSLAT